MPPDLRTTGSSNLPSQVAKPFWLVHSRRRALLFAIFAGAAVFCAAFFSERYLYHMGAPTMHMLAASNALAALLAFLFIIRILYRSIERRREMVERLQAIAEINHHIRNGLELIQLSTYTTADQQALAAVRAGVERIEWTLRQALGPVGPLGAPSSDVQGIKRDVA